MTGMTVKDLRAKLEGLPDDMRVIQQDDSEGNGYRWCIGAEADGVLVEDYGWSAEVYQDTWDATEADMDDDEWRALLLTPRVLVLIPQN